MESWDRVLRREVRQSARVAVIGVGNVGRGDDAAGALVARKLLAGRGALPKTALVIDAGDVPENCTGVVRVFKPDLAVIVDSARAGRPPGAVFLIDPAEVAEEDISTHRVPLSRLACYIRETMGSRVLILGIEPSSLEEGAAVIPAVGRAVKRVAEALRQALDAG
jgi:hydrogenase maturation protease HycI